MLTHPTIEKLQALHLTAMAQAFEQQRSSSQHAALSFEDRFGLRWRFQYHDSFWYFAGLVVGIRDHGCVGDRRMREQHCFEFCRWNLETLVLDQLLRAIHDVEVPIFIRVSNVTRMKPAVCINSL